MNIYIQWRNRRLVRYGHMDDEAWPTNITYNTGRQRFAPIGLIWVAFHRSDAYGYWTSRHEVSHMANTVDNLSTSPHPPTWLDRLPNSQAGEYLGSMVGSDRLNVPAIDNSSH